MSELGVIAAGSDQSVDAGAEMFGAGGNAVDAVVAAAFATAAGDAAITSLAGGGAFIYRGAGRNESEICDFFVSAPGLGSAPDACGTLDFGPVEIDFGVGGTTQQFHVGRGSAAVPGVIPGLVGALERWGSMSLADVVAPTVRLLRDGIEVTEYQATCFRILAPILRQASTGRDLFFGEDGETLKPGATFRNPQLASTLERMGREGHDAVYHRDIAAIMLEEFGEPRGGRLTRDDILQYQPTFRPTLDADYGGARVCTNPKPSVGGRFIMLTLALFETAELAKFDEDSPERYRRMTAVFRAVSEARAEGPDLVERPDCLRIVSRRLRSILDADPSPSTHREPRTPGNTTHISALDAAGNAAGVTISHGEGCGHWIGDTGLHMNNILGEEDLFPSGFHCFTPGVRLSTMMAPSIIAEPGGGLVVLGSGGSNRIRTAMAQVISALIDDQFDAVSAVCHGRLHFENGVLSAEPFALPGGSDALVGAEPLAREVKRFDAPSLFFGGVHLVRRSAEGALSGAGDPRRSGAVRRVAQ